MPAYNYWTTKNRFSFSNLIGRHTGNISPQYGLLCLLQTSKFHTTSAQLRWSIIKSDIFNYLNRNILQEKLTIKDIKPYPSRWPFLPTSITKCKSWITNIQNCIWEICGWRDQCSGSVLHNKPLMHAAFFKLLH